MRLESARALKQELLQDDLQGFLSGEEARPLGVSAKRMNRAGIVRSLALGVAPAPGGDFMLAVRVQQPLLQSSSILEALQRKSANEVDVRMIGHVRKQAFLQQSRQRPLRIGSSISHKDITAGTLGCFVGDPSGGDDVLMLSNNHVLADENRAEIGDEILQPGVFDGGDLENDVVARLHSFIPLDLAQPNLADAATGELLDGIGYDSENLSGIGRLRGLAAEVIEEGPVHKVGRTTGVTRGQVTAFDLDNVVVGYEAGNLRFDNQIEIEGEGSLPFSQGGDSGSLIVNDRSEAVGLLFAGSDRGGTNDRGLTFANPIAAVFDALRLRLIHSA